MMPTRCIVDAEKDANMKSLRQEEAIAILSDMKIDIPVPKAAVTQKKRNVALDMAISALSCSEIPNSSDSISRQMAIDAIDEQIEQCNKALGSFDIPPKDEYAIKVERASLKAYKEQLENMPSVQPERKKGQWLRYGEDGYPNNEDTVFWQCDQCLEQYAGRAKKIPNYCPNCGADMRKENES